MESSGFDGRSFFRIKRGDPKRHNLEGLILGKSEVVEVPTDVLVTATGNNLRIDGDPTRRVLICRIDPETERPELRKFDNDPIADAKVGRPRFVTAALLHASRLYRR